jgi:hypothetical protein
MKDQLRRLFGFLLNPLEKGTADYQYKPLNRTVLLVMSLVFLGLSLAVAWVAISQGAWSHLVAALIFGGVSILGLVVGLLGSDRAVAKLWGNK